jgi:hypothetical protein
MQSHPSFFHGTNVGAGSQGMLAKWWGNGGPQGLLFKKILANKQFAMFLGGKKNLAKFRQ